MVAFVRWGVAVAAVAVLARGALWFAGGPTWLRGLGDYVRWRLYIRHLVGTWKLPEVTQEAAGVTQLLILGSSVAAGEGAEAPPPGGPSWAVRLADALRLQGVEVHNRAVPWSTVGLWLELLEKRVDRGHLAGFDVVLLSLSTGNEGLPLCRTPESREAAERAYCDGLLALLRVLRSRLRPGARLVVGGPYPNDLYGPEHADVLARINVTIGSWKEVDHVVNFLGPGIHAGDGKWAAGTSRDFSHPNSLGHQRMFEALYLASILGPFANKN